MDGELPFRQLINLAILPHSGVVAALQGRLGRVTGCSYSIFGAADDIEFGAAQIAIKSLSCSGKVCALCALSALSTCPAAQAIANARKKSGAKSLVLMSSLAGFPPKTDPLLQKFDGQKGSLRLEPSSTSDNGTISLPTRYVLAGVPFVILRPSPLDSVASGWCPEVWCFPSCQNCSIKRTPERTLLMR